MKSLHQVLQLEIDNIEGKNEAKIKEVVQKAYAREYNKATRLPPNNPRRGQMQADLQEARETLLDPQLRHEYIVKWREYNAKGTPMDPEPDSTPGPGGGGGEPIFKFRNGDVATSIPELANLMDKNFKDATDALYDHHIGNSLSRFGEQLLADAAQAVITQFPEDRHIGHMAMVAILRGKVKMQSGDEAGTSEQLAKLIDKNWDQAKTLLYNGFIVLWLENTQKTELASEAKNITNGYGDKQDIGLEAFVQVLDPRIGHPKPEISHTEIDFGNMSSQKTIHFEIKNAGRGFLYGDVRLANDILGLQISDTNIHGSSVVTIHLDTSALTSKQAHQTSLAIHTNGRDLEVPIYVNYGLQRFVRRVAISGISMAALALVTRLIIQLFGDSESLATRVMHKNFEGWTQHWNWVGWVEFPWFGWTVYTLSAPGEGLRFVLALVLLGIGIFAYWCLVIHQKPLLIKNFFRRESAR